MAARVWWVPPALAAAVVAPLLLSRGFALAGDMVFVPRQPWKGTWTGADGGVPRAVPSDAWVSLATHLVPGDLLQKVVLLAMLAGAGWGVLALLRDRPAPAALAAAVLYQWNPFVHERLGIGHWALVCGYAALPWVVLAARRVGRPGWLAIAHLAVPLGVAAWTSPTGGVLAAVLAFAVAPAATDTGRRAIALGRAAGVAVAANLAWLLPGLLNSTGLPADPDGVAAFAARADTPYGLVGSLASLGGLWKASVDPIERSSWLLAGVALAVSVAGLLGLVRACRGPDRATDHGWLRPLAVVGCGSLVLVVIASTAPGAEILGRVVTDVPGGGLFRDTQKWIAPWALAVAVGFGELVAWSAGNTNGTTDGLGRRWYAAALVPIVCLPTLAWGLAGFWRPASYPAEWTAVASSLHEAGAGDDRVLVLPLGVYRRFSWAGERAVLDPAPRFFPGQVIVDDGLDGRGGVLVAGESEEAAALRVHLEDPDALAETTIELGIRWVVVEKDTPGRGTWPDGVGDVVHSGDQLTVVDLGEGDPVGRSRFAVLYSLADALIAAGWLACVALIMSRAARDMYARLLSGRSQT